ncbi:MULTISPECIES: cupin domain-containing protein [unclassified Streptomyces]|uniref:cupin domain-containing protein n=1 Tax=unclassified Streptomyces TaxID=2593676 RepID=UPI00344B1DD6
MTTDTARPATEPILIDDALSSFDALWSPRIMTRVNDYDVRVAKVRGDHIWHVHEDTDEFFLVVEGTLDIALRDGVAQEDERTVTLHRGAVFVVPRGTWHRPRSTDGACLMLFEPSGTSTVGDAHDPVPDHVDATTGHPLTR